MPFRRRRRAHARFAMRSPKPYAPGSPSLRKCCSRSVSPSKSSDNIGKDPPLIRMSNTARMLGWLSAAVARASCSKRRNRSASRESDGGKTLTATVLPRVAGSIHFSHAAGTEGGQNFIGTELAPAFRAIGERHWYSTVPVRPPESPSPSTIAPEASYFFNSAAKFVTTVTDWLTCWAMRSIRIFCRRE